MSSQRLWQQVPGLHRSQPVELPALRWGSRCELLFPTKNLSAINNHSQRKNSFLQGISLVIQTILSLRAGPMPSNRWPTQNEFKGLFILEDFFFNHILLYLGIFFSFLNLSGFLVVYYGLQF